MNLEMGLKEAREGIFGENVPSFLKNEKLRLVIFGGKGEIGRAHV